MKKLFFLVILIVATSLAYSQTASPELVSSAGDSYSNSTYQLSWSLGECVTATHGAGSYIITQGLHQDNYVVTAVEDLATDIKMSVYPNPTNNFIYLKTVDTKVHDLQYTVTDFTGKVLQMGKFSSDIEQLDFSNYATGNYLIVISKNKQLIKSFKIIKK